MGHIAAVIAGTPVDTAMGVTYLKQKDPTLEILSLPAAPTPEACTLLQIRPFEERMAYFEEVFAQAEARGCRDFFIYCNSLSGTVDYEALAAKRGVRVYTPLQIYREKAAAYDCLAVMAANNQSTAGIEKVMQGTNPSLRVCGLGYLALVEAVEAGLPPEELTARFDLATLCRFFEANGAQALVLGCTHFPYFKEALGKVTKLPLIDPAEAMYERLAAHLDEK